MIMTKKAFLNKLNNLKSLGYDLSQADIYYNEFKQISLFQPCVSVSLFLSVGRDLFFLSNSGLKDLKDNYKEYKKFLDDWKYSHITDISLGEYTLKTYIHNFKGLAFFKDSTHSLTIINKGVVQPYYIPYKDKSIMFFLYTRDLIKCSINYPYAFGYSLDDILLFLMENIAKNLNSNLVYQNTGDEKVMIHENINKIYLSL